MFAAVILVVVAELLTFGGVLRESWLAALLVSIAAFGVLFVTDIARNKLDLRLVLAVCIILGLSLLIGLQLATALLAGVWMWYACTRAAQKIPRFLFVLIIIGVFEALLGLYQYSVQPGWIFGYHNMFNRVSGTLINHNHYAGLLELVIFIPLAMAYQRWTEGEMARAYLYLLATAVMGLALLFSLSRMGMISFFVSFLFLSILIRFRDSDGSLPKSLGLGLIGLMLLGMVWIGVDVVVDRYADLIAPEQPRIGEGRPIQYRDTLRMIAANPFGVGPGKYQDMFRRYQTYDANVIFDHAHNDYLESTAEWGIIPAALFWIFIAVIFFRSIRLLLSVSSPGEGEILMACTGSILALLIHSLADFNLQIPVNATLFFSFVGMTAAFPLNRSFERDSDFVRDN